MLSYKGALYARFGRRYCATGRTGADWDDMQAKCERLTKAIEAIIDCYESGDTEGIEKIYRKILSNPTQPHALP
jgi:hypothetical protein